MRVAYVISAYKNPGQLSRLVERLRAGPGEKHFAVHVDRKTAPGVFEAMRLGVGDDVSFLPRHPCHWGGFGHVEASLKGIREVVRRGWDPDHVILLSAQDYPIKPPTEIRDFLERGRDNSFFLHFPLPTENWTNGGIDRFRHWHWRYRRLHLRVPLRRAIPEGLAPWGGSAYWIMSRRALRTVAGFVEAHPGYVRFFHHVDIPDELFFQTILLNSPEAERCLDVRLHHTEWSRLPAPAVLTMEDFPRLVASPCLFARKFDETVDERVLDEIDRQLLT